MKKQITYIFIVLLTSIQVAFSQTTATNFTVNDCSGVQHDLFTELESGKIIVITWVMPCGACLSSALTGYNEVENANLTNPGKVLYYLVDDYANTSCSSLKSWGTNNGMVNFTAFSNAAVDMADYGDAGMPKMVILAGNTHKIYYNVNDFMIDSHAVQDAINLALADLALGLESNDKNASNFEIFPNPSNGALKIKMDHALNGDYTFYIKDILGQIKMTETNKVVSMNQEINVDLGTLSSGKYFLHYIDNKESKLISFEVIR